MKLKKLEESFDDLKSELQKSRQLTRTAPKSYEIAYAGKKKQTGSRDRVNINIDLKNDDIRFITHTHPVGEGQGSLIGAMPSQEDLISIISLVMGSGQDKINKLTNTLINDPSDIEGSIIWNGSWYTVTIPTRKVNLSMVPTYENLLKHGKLEQAIQTLQRMGFHFEYGSKD